VRNVNLENFVLLMKTCATLESGTEVAMHAVTKSFKNEKSECLLLVDATNAMHSTNLTEK